MDVSTLPLRRTPGIPLSLMASWLGLKRPSPLRSSLWRVLPAWLLALAVFFGLSAEAVNATEMKLVSDSPLPALESGSEFEIRAFSALPDKLFQPGDSAGLSWSVPGATTVTLIDNNDGTRLDGLQAQGVVRVAPTTTTTYTLSAKGPSGAKTAQIQIRLASEQRENQWKSRSQAKSQRNRRSLQQVQQLPESIGASLTALGDSAVYQGNFDGNYYRFSADGELSWMLEDIGVVMSQAAVLDGVAYVGANSAEGGQILALKADKSILWQVPTESGVIASPVLSTDHNWVFAVSYNGTVYALDAADGREQWRYQLPEGETVNAAPALDEEGTELYIHSTRHKVFALTTGLTPSSSQGLVLHSSSAPTVIVPLKTAEPEPQPALLWQRDLQSEDMQPGNNF